MNVTRVAALLGKELLDLRGRPALFWPACFTGAVAIFLPVFVVVLDPGVHRRTAVGLVRSAACARALSRPAVGARRSIPKPQSRRVIFQQFLVHARAVAGGGGDVARRLQRDRREAGTLARAAARDADQHVRAALRQDTRRVPSGAGAVVACFALYVAVAAVFARPGVFWCCSRRARSACCFCWARWPRWRRSAGRVRVVAGQRCPQRPAARRCSCPAA